MKNQQTLWILFLYFWRPGQPWFPFRIHLWFYMQISGMTDLTSSVSQRTELRNETSGSRQSFYLQKYFFQFQPHAKCMSCVITCGWILSASPCPKYRLLNFRQITFVNGFLARHRCSLDKLGSRISAENKGVLLTDFNAHICFSVSHTSLCKFICLCNLNYVFDTYCT